MEAEASGVRPGVWRRWDAKAPCVPLVLDSPHSGTIYPADFGHAAPIAILRRSEDTHVDALFSAAPLYGATLLGALFPRSYIDANRALEDLDPALLEAPWPAPIDPGQKTRLGIGLISRLCGVMVPIYDRKLTVAEVANRIDVYWRPYHRELDRLLDGIHARFGIVFHVDCHSMPPAGVEGMAADAGRQRADFVLGDRDGTTCMPEFTAVAREFLAARGYSVRCNDPFKGVELVRKHGLPVSRRHSLQIEVNRKLYLEEDTREPSTGFARTRDDLSALIAHLAGFARAQTA